MLIELQIQDFALVRQARVALDRGLCVLSGETGAGKSIVIDAIGALVGERASQDLIRTGAEAARLRAVFDLSDAPAVRERLAELGLEADPDGLCIIAREIRANGRGRATVNGATATVGMLRQLGEALIDIHGQHEHQSLMRVAEHVHVLDNAGGAKVAAARAAYRQIYDQWRAAGEELSRLRQDEGERERRLDLLRFQVGEIDAANLRPGEAEELLALRGRLAHAERLVEAAGKAYAALQEAEQEPAAMDRVAAALHAVQDMARYDAGVEALAADLSQAMALLGEAARTLADYVGQVEADPHELNRVEERLEQLDRLQRKYGGSEAAVLEFGAAAQAELDGLEHADERLAALEHELAARSAELATAGGALTAARRRAADELVAGVTHHLRELGMAAVQFAVELQPREPVAGGLDAVEFLFSANPGEPPRPLARIASGGEISRVMLALKSQVAASVAVPTMIFDEIDVGIGGVTIGMVARKMAEIARRRQVIVVTHHAPIAAHADVHVGVEKAPGDGATDVRIERFEGEERVYELARMLGRQPPTDATLAMARELLAELA